MLLSEFLTQFSNQEVYYKPNPGNGGDALIAAGAYKYFRLNNIKLIQIVDAENFEPDNKVIFYPGGGNLIPEYQNAADFLGNVHNKAAKLILLPHTVSGHLDLLKSFGKNVTLFAREKHTKEYLDSLNLKCEVNIDNDMAFVLNPADFVDYTHKPKEFKNLTLYRKIKGIRYDFRTLNCFRSDVERTSFKLPIDNIDISNVINYRYQMDDVQLVMRTVSDIFRFLSFFSTVNTNRLHIAIAGALLGKKVNLYPNSYWKNKAMYDYSLRPNNNVCFCETE